MIKRIVLPITYVTGKLSAADFDAQVSRALAALNDALNKGYQIMTQQFCQASTGGQLTYILYKPTSAVAKRLEAGE